MILKPASPEAMDLLMTGTLAFSRIEQAGLRIDVPYLDKAITDTRQEIKNLEKRLSSSREYKAWAKRYGNDMNLESSKQLGHVIFNVLGHKRNPYLRQPGKKKTKDDTNAAAAFEHLKLPFTQDFFHIKRLKKAVDTFLVGIRREIVDGYVHPFQDLFIAESYRSSSSKPNFHNLPVRNKQIARIIRSSVVPRLDHEFIEGDFSTQEARTIYCYNHDRVFREDVLHGDMHRDRAKELFLLTDEELGPTDKDPGKLVRYVGKNKFVFAQFYGSYFQQNAPDLWDAISLYDLRTAQGISLYEHLASKGIKWLGACDPELKPKRGTYEYHVKEVEEAMWSRYKDYAQWKKDWYAQYLREGGVNSLTGFRMEGLFRRNQILCDVNQGSAFHCLLWATIRIQRAFRKYKMKSLIVDQVHDSILVDAHKKERRAVVEIMHKYAVEDIARHWPWIIIPLQMEFEVAEPNWYEKRPLEMAA